MNKLKDLALTSGLNLKRLAELSHVPYTTVQRYAKQPVDSWDSKYTQQLTQTLDCTVDQLNEPVMLPFIKWVGGKRQLLPELIKYVPKNFNYYYEPFIGGGALFLKIAPKHAVINDYNEELINTWNQLRDAPDQLFEVLQDYQSKDSKDFYYGIRSVDRTGEIVQMNDVERAARMIYMNKAGFNGLYRVNRKGQNNVPYGGHKSLNLVPDFMKDDSRYLRKNDITILNGDYAKAVESAEMGDFVYMDSPYIPVTPTSAFVSYTKDGFGLVQQEQLAKTARQLARKGVKVMLSNSDVPLIEKLYPSSIWNIHHVKARRAINSNGKKRGEVGEVIITNY